MNVKHTDTIREEGDSFFKVIYVKNAQQCQI